MDNTLNFLVLKQRREVARGITRVEGGNLQNGRDGGMFQYDERKRRKLLEGVSDCCSWDPEHRKEVSHMWEEVYFSQLQEAKICKGGAQRQRDSQDDGFYFLCEETNHPLKSEGKSEGD